MKLLRGQVKRSTRIFCDHCGTSHAWNIFDESGNINEYEMTRYIKRHSSFVLVMHDLSRWTMAFSKRIMRKRTGRVDCTVYVAYCPTCQRELNKTTDDVFNDYIDQLADDSTLISTVRHWFSKNTRRLINKRVCVRERTHINGFPELRELFITENVRITDAQQANTTINIPADWISASDGEQVGQTPCNGMIGKVVCIVGTDEIPYLVVKMSDAFCTVIQSRYVEHVPSDSATLSMLVGNRVKGSMYMFPEESREENLRYLKDTLKFRYPIIANTGSVTFILGLIPDDYVENGIVSGTLVGTIEMNNMPFAVVSVRNDLSNPLIALIKAETLSFVDTPRPYAVRQMEQYHNLCRTRYGAVNQETEETIEEELEEETSVVSIWLHHIAKSL